MNDRSDKSFEPSNALPTPPPPNPPPASPVEEARGVNERPAFVVSSGLVGSSAWNVIGDELLLLVVAVVALLVESIIAAE